MNSSQFVVTALMNATDVFNQLDNMREQFRRAGRQIEATANPIQRATGLMGAFAGGAGVGLAIAAVQGLGMVVQGVMNSIGEAAIGMTARLETATFQFAALMGDWDKAEAHVRTLFELAEKTPFRAEEIITASRWLEVFGGAALNNVEYITMMGDASAATGAALNEVTFWVGRLYSNLQAGVPVGEASLRLLELAVISSQTKTQIDALVESGASADEIFTLLTDDLGRFAGAMALQEKTITGLSNTVKDMLGMRLMEAFAPLGEAFRQTLFNMRELLDSEGMRQFAANVAVAVQNVLDSLNAMVVGGATAFANLDGDTVRAIGRIAGFMQGLGNLAVTWGTGIVEAIATGIRMSIRAVELALQALGNLLTYWLQPHSPPNLLPDLDDWGTQTAEVYLQGWTKADFSALQEFGSTMQSYLDGLVVAGDMDEEDVIPAVLRIRDAFAEALEQFQETGSVSEEAFQAIATSAGAAGAEALALARAYFTLATAQNQLTAAQEELNQVNEYYGNILDDLNEQLEDLSDQQEQLSGEERARAIRNLLTQQDLTPERRAALELELQQIAIEAQINDVEDAHEEAAEAAQGQVDVAQQAVDQAQAEYDLLLGTLDVRSDSLDLMNQQEQLMARLLAAMDSVAEKQKEGLTALEKALKILNEHLLRITLQQDEMRDLYRLAEINKELQDETLTAYERETLELEKQEIAIKRKIRQLQAMEIGLDLSPLEDMPIVLKEKAEKGGKDAGDAIGEGIASALDLSSIELPELKMNELFEIDFSKVKEQFDKGFGEGFKSFDNFSADIGKLFEPLSGKFDGLTESFTDLTDGIQKLLDEKDKVVEFFEQAWIALAVFGGALFIANIITAIAGAFAILAPWIGWIAGGFATLAATLAGSGIVAAILPVAAAVAAIVAVLFLLKAAWDNNFLGIRDSLTNAWNNQIQPAFAEMGRWIGEELPGHLAWFEGEWNKGWTATADGYLGNYENIKLSWDETVTYLTQTIPNNLNTFKNLWLVKWEQIKTGFIDSVWTPIKTTWDNAGTYLTVTLPSNLATLRSKWVEEFGTVKTDLATWWTDVSGKFQELKTWLDTKIGEGLTTLKTKWDEVWNGIRDEFEDVSDEIVGFIEDVWEEVQDLWDNLLDFIEWLGTVVVENPFSGVGGNGGNTSQVTPLTSVAPVSVSGEVGKADGSTNKGVTNIWQIDARGSNLSEDDFRRIIKETQNETGRRAEQITKTRR